MKILVMKTWISKQRWMESLKKIPKVVSINMMVHKVKKENTTIAIFLRTKVAFSRVIPDHTRRRNHTNVQIVITLLPATTICGDISDCMLRKRNSSAQNANFLPTTVNKLKFTKGFMIMRITNSSVHIVTIQQTEITTWNYTSWSILGKSRVHVLIVSILLTTVTISRNMSGSILGTNRIYVVIVSIPLTTVAISRDMLTEFTTEENPNTCN